MVELKDFDDLNSMEKIVLSIICKINNFSLKAHTSPQLIIKRIRIQGKKYVRNALKTLKTNWFVVEHPTRGGITIQLTKKGLIGCKKLFEE